MIALVTGGASSGKSGIAEELCTTLGAPMVYLATMRSLGDEGAHRVARHRAMRDGKGFATLECHGPLTTLPTDAVSDATVLLEDLCNLVANALFDSDDVATMPRSIDDAAGGLAADVLSLARRCRNLVIVGNEVGEDGVVHVQETQRYQMVLGMLSQHLAAESDLTIVSVCGAPVILKAPDVNDPVVLSILFSTVSRGRGAV